MRFVLKKTVDEDDEDDDSRIVPDGGRVNVAPMLMDHILPSRRFAFRDDGDDEARARAQEAYAARSRRLAEAYKQKPPLPPSNKQRQDDRLSDAELRALDLSDLKFRAEQARLARDARLVSAYKQGRP